MVGLGDVIKDLNQYTLRSVHPEAADGAACFSEQWWRELVSGYRFPSACAHVGPCSRVWDLSPAFFVALSISLSVAGQGLLSRKKKWPNPSTCISIDLFLPRYQRRSVAGTCGRGTCCRGTCGVAESRCFFKASRDFDRGGNLFLLWRSSVATKDFSSLSANTPWTHSSGKGSCRFRCSMRIPLAEWSGCQTCLPVSIWQI